MKLFDAEGVIRCSAHDRPIAQCRHRALGGAVDERATALTQAHRLRVGHLREFVVPEEIGQSEGVIRGVDTEEQALHPLRDRRALRAQRLALGDGE